MKIVIDIEEDYYKIIQHDVEHGMNYKPCVLIANGTPLPEHHGRLIDADALYENTEICHSDIDGYACVTWKDINDTPIIIEADKE